MTVYSHDTQKSRLSGFQSYMAKVYQYMALGLGITGATAFFVSTSPMLFRLVHTFPLSLIVMIAPFGLVMMLSTSITRLSPSTAYGLFLGYAISMGVSLSHIFLVFTGQSIFQVFFMAAALFLAMSLYGSTTKKDLSSWGSFLIMGIWGILGVSLVNMFLGHALISGLVSIVSIIIFTAFTAYDVQEIRRVYHAFSRVTSSNEAMVEKSAIIGALKLYMDMVNIFIQLLYLFGSRRDS